MRALCSASPAPGAIRPSRPSLQTRRLKAHLRAEMASTKAVVAREFHFDDDVICMTLARHFLKTGRAFKNAGDLVDELTELTLAKDLRSNSLMIEGVADLVNQLTPPPLAGSRTSPPVMPVRTTTPPPLAGSRASPPGMPVRTTTPPENNAQQTTQVISQKLSST